MNGTGLLNVKRKTMNDGKCSYARIYEFSIDYANNLELFGILCDDF